VREMSRAVVGQWHENAMIEAKRTKQTKPWREGEKNWPKNTYDARAIVPALYR
jgi:hypothetical protein